MGVYIIKPNINLNKFTILKTNLILFRKKISINKKTRILIIFAFGRLTVGIYRLLKHCF